MADSINVISSSTEKIKHLVKILELNQKRIPCTTSLKIAEIFGKRHDHVLRDIERLQKVSGGDLPISGEMFYKDSHGRDQKMYILEETFTCILLAGFKGKKALDWKIAYVKEFQRMRNQLAKESRIVRTKFDEPAERNTFLNEMLVEIREKMGKETKSHHFIALAGIVNEIAFGEKSKDKELRKNMNLEEYQNLNRTLSGITKAVLKGHIHKKEIQEFIEQYKLFHFKKKELN